jgi:hypothetical protein
MGPTGPRSGLGERNQPRVSDQPPTARTPRRTAAKAPREPTDRVRPSSSLGAPPRGAKRRAYLPRARGMTYRRRQHCTSNTGRHALPAVEGGGGGGGRRRGGGGGGGEGWTCGSD